MIIDTSAVIAIIFKEDGYMDLIDKMMGAEYIGIGTATLAETGIVLCARLEAKGRMLLALFLQEAGIVQIPFGEDHWREAVNALSTWAKTSPVADTRYRAGVYVAPPATSTHLRGSICQASLLVKNCVPQILTVYYA